MSGVREALESGDIETFLGLWGKLRPDLPLPANREQAAIVMHRARTEAASVSFKARAYSHRWLTERLIPSGLPDHLRPKAERIYPVVVDAVGVSFNTSSPLLKPAVKLIQGAMCDAVEDAYAHGRKEPVFVRARMAEAKDKAIVSLFGRGAKP